ncbi:hypothetical protein DM806_16905 [Sphingobium lactosutens]|nr:hypothetical protein [Sphingobium lactosutens]
MPIGSEPIKLIRRFTIKTGRPFDDVVDFAGFQKYRWTTPPSTAPKKCKVRVIIKPSPDGIQHSRLSGRLAQDESIQTSPIGNGNM